MALNYVEVDPQIMTSHLICGCGKQEQKNGRYPLWEIESQTEEKITVSCRVCATAVVIHLTT
jgi:hypothetical protein